MTTSGSTSLRGGALRVGGAIVLGIAVVLSVIGTDTVSAHALGSPVLLSITVSPTAVSVPQGETEQFTATGHYSDGSTEDLTDQVTWSTSASSVATISNASGSQGQATAVGTGAATITADDSGALLSGTAALTVVPAVLIAVDVAPPASNVPVGESQQLSATGDYSNGTTTNLTDVVTWSSSDSSEASVSSKGLVKGVATGAVTITADDSAALLSGTAAITVVSPVLLAVTVSPLTANVPVGETVQLTATGDYSDGSTSNLTGSVTWSSSDSSDASVSSTGLVTGVATGAATITATDSSAALSGEAAVTVLPAVLLAVTVSATDPSTSISGEAAITILDATLTAISVSPPITSVAAGDTVQMTATGIYSDGTTVNLTDDVTWSSSDSSEATVSSTGLVTGVSTGAVTIEAADPSASIDGTAAVTVSPAELVAVTVSPALVNLPAGETEQLTATGYYSDGSTKNLTHQVTWSSSDSSDASVTSDGLVTAVSVGAATIQATDPTTSISGTAAVTVLPAVLLDVTVTPPAQNVPVGETQQMTATGIYSDGTTSDLTDSVTWSSSDSSEASVSSKGVVTGVATGAVTITATYSSTSVSGTAAITVEPAVLVAISVNPPEANVPVGETQKMTATGDYSDGSTANLTRSVTWSSSDSSEASVTQTGLVTANAIGAVTITATDPSTGIFGVAAIAVVPAVLVAITINPPAASLNEGQSEQFYATGDYSDGSMTDLTDEVTWSTTDSSVAAVTSTGEVTAGDTTGAATITATDPSSLISGASAVTVLPGVLVAIEVSPASPSVSQYDTTQLTATGIYSNAATADLTDQVTWSSEDSSTASVSNANGSQGVVTGVAVGSTTITAEDPSSEISGSQMVTVTGPAITLSPSSGPKKTKTSVSGQGFTPGTSIKVAYETGLTTPAKVKLCIGRVSDLGTFTCNVVIPGKKKDGADGLHTVIAKAVHTKSVLAQTTFLLEPST